jgi:hypothetical protein
MIDQTTQAILTVGMPTLAVLIGIPVNNSRLSDLRASMDPRFSAIEKVMDARFAAVDARFEAAHQKLLRVKGVLDAQFKHLDERLKHLEGER